MTHAERVAIVGLGAVLPGGLDVATVWSNLAAGRDSIGPVPAEIWDRDVFLDPSRSDRDKVYSPLGAVLRGFEFRPSEFGLPPISSQQMDPIQPVALVAARQALADAGITGPTEGVNAAVILGNLQGGVQLRGERWFRVAHPALTRTIEQLPSFRGLSEQARRGFLDELERAWRDQFPSFTSETMPGVLGNLTASRVAHFYNFHGPAQVVDAACASSLAALDASVTGLLAGRWDLAVSGGVDMMMDAPSYVGFCAMGALSPDGSFPFDRRANGFVMGEGGVAVVLKRLSDARRDGDRVYAVVRGIGSSSDGRGRSIVAPNPDGQVRAMRAAYRAAELDPAKIGYVEAHGTATPIGDPTEIYAMRQVFTDSPLGSISIGSVKANMGHLKGAAGAAGLLRAVLALHHQTIPPHANFESPNPACELEQSPFRIPRIAEPWSGGVRFAGLSAFGFGGINYHVVLESADVSESPGSAARVAAATAEPPLGMGVIAFGGASRQDLLAEARRLRERASDPLGLARACARGVAPVDQPVRVAFFAEDQVTAEKLLDSLIAVLEKGGSRARLEALGIALRENEERFAPDSVAFMFPGQGSQYLSMLDELRGRFPVVQETLDEADGIMAELLEQPLSSYISPSSEVSSGEAFLALLRTEVLQPAMLTCDEALRRLIVEVVEPRVVLGHSLGEYAACVAAGVLEFADCLQIVAARGGAMEQVSMDDNGLMLGVAAGEAAVLDVLAGVDGYAAVVNKNCPSQTIIAGATPAVKEAQKRFRELGTQCMQLPVSHAFHSEIVAPASAPLRRALDRVQVGRPRTPILSNVTGDFYPDGDAVEVAEWVRDTLARQVASPVEFIQDVETAYADGCRVFIEVGPKRAQAGFVADILKGRPHRSLILAHPKQGELVTLGRTLAALVVDGVVAYGVPRPISTSRSATLTGAIPRRPPYVQTVEASPDTLAARAAEQAAATATSNRAAGAGIEGVARDPRFWQFLALQGPALANSMVASYQAAQALAAGSGDAVLTPTAGAPLAQAAEPAVATTPPAQPATAVAAAAADIEGWMLERVAAATGYEVAELDLDAELEAELGIDSIRQIEIVLGVSEELGLPTDEGFSVSDYPNLRSLIGYVEGHVKGAGSNGSGASQSPAGSPPSDLTGWVLERVAKKTGYALEELDLDAELEAELGIDSIRQIEILMEVRDELELPADDTFQPSDHPNLRSLIGYLEERRGESSPF